MRGEGPTVIDAQQEAGQSGTPAGSRLRRCWGETSDRETGVYSAFMATTKGTALITGASAGIGATFARQLAAGGYDLVLVARRLAELEQLAVEIRGQPGVAVEVIGADLTRDDDVAAVCSRLASMDNLTLLVNNAGFGTRGLFFGEST